ncbi:MAG: malate synthase G [Gammaproteobacteria bacterium]|nr:malate synthase G [Gammaproteobacteria bacterium]
MDYSEVAGLKVSANIRTLVDEEIAPGTDVTAEAFWQSLAAIISRFAPDNRMLLEERDRIQREIDDWVAGNRSRLLDTTGQKAFLESIGYIVEEGGPFKVDVSDVDDEIALIAGPQLVVPVQIARYALNAANARWGSLYDAVYGTDVIGAPDTTEPGYDPDRGRAVVAYVKDFLDRVVPLGEGTYADVVRFALQTEEGIAGLRVTLRDGTETGLADDMQFAGYNTSVGTLTEIFLKNNGLHIRLLIDPEHAVGRQDLAGIKDVVLESAVTTIQDFEDSVAAVDAADKELVYRNWLGLMNGSLETPVEKNGSVHTRRLHPDLEYFTPEGTPSTLHGRSVLFVRTVGLHMYTDCVLDPQGNPTPEGILDTMVAGLAAKHDLGGAGPVKNSRKGSVYIVKPKLHGPEEVKFTIALFEAVEDALKLPAGTIKIGIMDEERRTTVNLKECIRAARSRVVFINTGFLDRTGDEIHTVMNADAVVPKPEIKDAAWIKAYENWNVDIGIETGLPGHGQIGKGMWPMPDSMKAMVDTKSGHPEAGASTAWVPSPTAATLHAMHYHQVSVADRQRELAGRQRADIHDLLTPSLLGDRRLERDEIEKEMDNNAQGILGYVVRWIGQGVGCSKVPDINDVNLMEDRATLRISSQHIANWLEHGIVTREQVVSTMQRMARIVDQQNVGDPAYQPMAPDFETSVEFNAALDLVFHGVAEPNGYTENILHTRRREKKQQIALEGGGA